MKWQSWNRVLGLSSRAIFLTTQRLLDVAAVVQLDFIGVGPEEVKRSQDFSSSNKNLNDQPMLCLKPTSGTRVKAKDLQSAR